MAQRAYAAIFSDIGGVLGTNGWDTDLRMKIAKHFSCSHEDLQARHRLMFDSYERGFMTFQDYIQAVFCGSSTDYSWQDVRDYAYNESIPWPDNINLLKRVKESNGLKLALISNEGEGLTEHRVRKFRLREVADFMVFSHFVHLRKPDRDMWKLALNLAQVEAEETIYIDDRKMFADIAGSMGFRAIHHTSLEKTRSTLESLGLETESGRTIFDPPA